MQIACILTKQANNDIQNPHFNRIIYNDYTTVTGSRLAPVTDSLPEMPANWNPIQLDSVKNILKERKKYKAKIKSP